MMRPTRRWSVSVVVPCYRSGETIDRAVRSVLAQTELPSELILVDDASPDGGATLARLHRLAIQASPFVPTRIVPRDRNGGAAAARNSGWAAAQGDWIAFLDADDAWHPRKIELQCGWLDAHQEVSLCGHGWKVLTPSDSPDWALPERWDASKVTYSRLLPWNRFLTPTVMVRRGVKQRFREEKRYSEDYLLWLELLAEGTQAAYLELPLACLFKPHYGASGLSAQLWQLEKGELAAYATLHSEGRLPAPAYYPLSALSLAKFARRAVITALRRSR
jgi:glycosyltransferase involved in cell wall biosynthesis